MPPCFSASLWLPFPVAPKKTPAKKKDENNFDVLIYSCQGGAEAEAFEFGMNVEEAEYSTCCARPEILHKNAATLEST